MRAVIVLAAIAVLAALTVDAADGVQAYESMRWHVRAAAPSASPALLTMTWNDGAGKLAVTVPSLADDDPVGGCEARYRYFYCDSMIEEGTVPVEYCGGDKAGLSVVVKADIAGAVAEIGATGRVRSVRVSYDRLNPGVCDATIESGELLRNDMLVRHLPAPMYSRFESVDSLMSYLGASSNPAEGVWRYLDRDMRPEKAVPGGYYTLATVADGNGGYEIVYLGGARYGEGSWQPLRLKGRLSPSGFADNYDLEWQAGDGRACPPESYATLDAETGILALYFPLLDSSFRFRRVSSRR